MVDIKSILKLVYEAKEELKTKKRWCDFIKVFMKVVYGLKPKIQFHKRNWLQKAKKTPSKNMPPAARGS